MSKKILANDGIDASGKALLEKAGFTVVTDKVPQNKLQEVLNADNYVAITVRSATQVRKDLIDACPGIKAIARGGVGMDNIDVDYAKSKGIDVINTPAASSHSVAELVFAHLFGAVRFLYDSNRQMPTHGHTEFESLKKKYAKGIELKGKTLGIVGFGRIGQAVARIGLGLGMHIKAHDPYIQAALINLDIQGVKEPVRVNIHTIQLEQVLEQSDFITMHVPGGDLITSKEIATMKKGVILVNASRGGVIDERSLLDGLNTGKIAHACLDVFTGEPKPSEALLRHPKISMTPHIGAATEEAQERIGLELAEKLIATLS
ncbi:MAG TPA: D-2-hydroxyacid dehydrogenase [Bacteroidia bacterium]|nr:D-2-hydroxyacid dehydrogenase [Bacteroidia bacterium]